MLRQSPLGPAVAPPASCNPADLTGDDRVDLFDVIGYCKPRSPARAVRRRVTENHTPPSTLGRPRTGGGAITNRFAIPRDCAKIRGAWSPVQAVHATSLRIAVCVHIAASRSRDWHTSRRFRSLQGPLGEPRTRCHRDRRQPRSTTPASHRAPCSLSVIVSSDCSGKVEWERYTGRMT